MTTTVKVEVPDHANWKVDVEVKVGDAVVEHIVLEPGSGQWFTVYDDRVVSVKEIKP
jgi:hypothetical protein